ncbi:MAG: response regulator, partial [Saprospiraceae bacterium]|nr:response regulator [Saprospiraceae bacterium]
PVSLFLEEQHLEGRVKKLLESVRKNSNHLLGLVESILDLSKLEQQTLVLEEKVVHFPGLVRLIFSMYEAYAEMHQIGYHLHYKGSEQLYLLLDKAKLEKILHNLIDNALKYNSKLGKVDIWVEELPNTIRIQVIDIGIGIHPDDLPHIFERYFQSKQPNAPIQGGSGIGLAIAQEYAQLMQGELRAESQLNKGSTFTFVFPKKIVQAPKIVDYDYPLQSTFKIPDLNQNGNTKNGKPELLIVEDNVEMQELLLQITSPHFEVLQAANGEIALEILQRHSVDCVLTDLMMPHMDGFELIAALKKNPTWQWLPVVALTARANEQDKLQTLRFGIDDYLYKPFSPHELLARLQNLAKNYQNRLKSQRLQNLAQETLQSADQQWVGRLESSTMQLLKNDPEFTLIDLANEMNLSERHLRRKVHEIIGMTANEYIREIRLQKARQLLEQKAMNTIAEVSYAVGFSSVGYFTKVFSERFGRKPSEYL